MLALVAVALPLFAQETARRLPLVTVTAPAPAAPGGLREMEPADETGRPDWTSSRRFSTTRVYLQMAPWEVAFEQWMRFRHFRDGTRQVRFYEEIEIGLPYRLQLDIYEKWVSDEDRNADHDEMSFELRWAPANWGKLPLNPAFYVEWAQVNKGANVLESKILLGEDFTPRLHWGFNFVWERELGRELTNQFQLTQGLSYTLIDEVVSAGVEMVYKFENKHADRDEYEQQFLIGPSIQIRPTKRTHLDLVALIGTNDDSPNVEGYIIFGIELGRLRGGEKSEGYTPAAGRAH